MMKAGVLALQGAFREHQTALEKCGVEVRQVRQQKDLAGIEALVIPGGESTTIGKLIRDFQLMVPIREMALDGMPVFGTCGGLIMLAKQIKNSRQTTLNLMDVEVERNAFGRQIDSFEADLSLPVLGSEPFHAVFIRAPYITGIKSGVEPLASYGNKIVCARQGRLLVTAFHPELTEDLRMHRFFIENVANS